MYSYKLCVGSSEDHHVFKVTLSTMKGGFLQWEPLGFTTSFLWRQSCKNMCQVVEQEWWCPALLREWTLFFHILLRWNQTMLWDSALSTTIKLSTCIFSPPTNELFVVILGSQWTAMLQIFSCNLFQEPEGRSPPPSHWDNISLSALCWNEVFDVCVLRKGGGSKSSPAVKVAVTYFLLTSHLSALMMALWQQEAVHRPECQIHVAMQYFCASSKTKRERKQLRGPWQGAAQQNLAPPAPSTHIFILSHRSDVVQLSASRMLTALQWKDIVVPESS